MSAPSCSGRCNAGVQKQLSTASHAPTSCAMFAEGAEIADLGQRIRRRFDEEQARIRLCRRTPFFRIGRRDERGLDTEAPQNVLEQLYGGTEDRTRGDDMFAGFHQAHHGGRASPPCGRESNATLGAFQRGKAFLEHIDARIGENGHRSVPLRHRRIARRLRRRCRTRNSRSGTSLPNVPETGCAGVLVRTASVSGCKAARLMTWSPDSDPFAASPAPGSWGFLHCAALPDAPDRLP